jgi:hypothetical protein
MRQFCISLKILIGILFFFYSPGNVQDMSGKGMEAFRDIDVINYSIEDDGEQVTFFSEDFEDTDFASKGWYDNTNLITDETEYHGGNRSARFRWLQGAIKPESGGTIRKKFTESSSLYVSYWVKYSSNYTGSNKPYHPHEFYILTNKNGDWTGPAYTHLTAYIEHNEGNPRLGIQDGQNIDEKNIGTDLANVTEQRAVAGCNGNGTDSYTTISCYPAGSVHWNGKGWKNTSVTISNDVWHHVEVYFRLNSISDGKGKGDGVLRYWLDGEKLIDRSDVIFRTGQHPDMKFNQFLIGPWIGNGSPVNQAFWIDDLVVAKRPIVY